MYDPDLSGLRPEDVTDYDTSDAILSLQADALRPILTGLPARPGVRR